MKPLILAGVLLGLIALTLGGASVLVAGTMPAYRDSAGDVNYTEKITGLYLLEQSAARGDNLIIYGSSELRTTEVSTHPANFFAGKRFGFQVNLVGRGSCQSIIHAISIAASGDSLKGKSVALITSPQSYVREGIAPDLFMANFSEQQYLELLAAEELSADVKQYISERVATLLDRYEAMPDTAGTAPAVRYMAEHHARPALATSARNAVLAPYYAFERYLLDLKDKISARALLRSLGETPPATLPPDVDWAEAERAAISEAREMTSNNEFGILNDYYTTHIGARLARQKDKDSELDYSVSEEYGDLRILFEVCRQKGIDPLFVHVPLHGGWSDYTGYTAERRQEYYRNVRAVAEEFGVRLLDLTEHEYEEYFLCDVMHLGWKGWLEVDRALVEYYNGG